MATWQIFVKGVGGKTSIVRVSPDCSIDHFMREVSKDNNVPVEEIRIIYTGKQLEYGAQKTLDDYKISNMSTVFIVLRLRGGWNPLLACKMKKIELEPLEGMIRVVTDEPDMISLDDDPNCKRAKMPCGHVIGPDSMTSYAMSIVDQGKYLFYCPYIAPNNVPCNKEWPYFLVRHVACMNPDDMQKLETKITENYIHKDQGIQQCPGCESWCFRNDNKSNRVTCIYCIKKGNAGKAAEFCWACLKPWRRNDDVDCGNPECDGLDPRLRHLRDAPLKEIIKTKCPSVRACPKCGILIDHKDGCKHVTCTACKTSFCFLCLKTQVNGKWQCGSYNDVCSLAPRQVTLPGGSNEL